jgi:hypothetical protein
LRDLAGGDAVTTSQSPIAQLRGQAENIAGVLKRAEAGAPNGPTDPAHKFSAARCKPSVTVGIVQDDKLIRIEFPWSQIHDTTEAGIAEFILDYMRGVRDEGTRVA